MNGNAPKQITVNLSFLGKAFYDASYVKDNPARQTNSISENQIVSNKMSLTTGLNAAGGFVGRFVKK